MRRAVLSVVVVVLSLAAPVAQAACNPAQQCCADPGTGDPCDAAAGNPLNVISGNKFQREVDMPALPGVLGLELVRHYNSQDSHTFSARRLLGRGWRLSYDVQVQRQGLQGLTLTQADGTQVHYYRVPVQPDRLAGTLYRSNQPHQGDMLLRGNSDPRIRYVLTLPDKSQQWFDAQGLLVQLNVPSGQATDILRDPQGRILRVTDPQGRELRFTYPSAAQRKDTVQFHGVQSIDTPVGTFHYTYDTPAPQVLTQPPDSPAYRRAAQRLANLLQVQGPGPTTKTYHYEDQRWPTLLTGISIAGTGIKGTQRQVSWAYDSRGRAILSVKGAYDKSRAGPEQVTLDFSGQKTDGSGTTVLTNSLGQTTRYTYHSINHKPELVEVIGPGCASCGPTNVRHGYNAKGQRTSTTQLDAQGAPLHTTLTQYDGADRPIEIRQVRYLRGKAQAAQLLQRIDYGADPETLKPRLLERPSVVPGKQHRILFTYNQAGQPTEITETGYEPIGQQPISRTTRYAYTSINGRSLLTHIDGPLPNGPANSPRDSDITTVQWDARGGYILRRTEPGHITTTLEHDSAGRLVRSSLNDGHRLVQTDTRYAASSPLQPDQFTRTAWLLQQGTPDKSSEIRQTPWIAQADSSNSNVVPTGSGSATHPWPPSVNPQTNPVEPASLQVEEEGAGLLGHVGDPGTAAHAKVLQFEANGKHAQRQLDDFGRVVAIRHPGQGWQYALYDEASRITRTTDARGVVQRADYNLFNRLIKLQRSWGDRADETVVIQWLGGLRASESVQYGQGITRHETAYTYNPLGWITERRVRIHQSDGLPIELVSRASHDDAGRVVARTLPSGQRIAYRYYAEAPYQGQLAQVMLVRWPRWLDWIMVPLGGLLPQDWMPATELARRAPADAEPQPMVVAQQIPPIAGLSNGPPGETFDASGLPARLATSKGALGLQWNSAGQLHQIIAADGTSVAEYRYDAQGRRAAKRTDKGWEYYLYEGTQLLAAARTRDGKVRITDEYLYAGYLPIAWLRNATGYALQTDARGAVLAVRDLHTQQPLWQADSDAWGFVASNADPAMDPKLRLVNQYHDEETGLHYHVARYYDPRSGRFISPDPRGIEDSIDEMTPASLYLDTTAYAAGRPYDFFDPDGAAKITYYAITSNDKGQPLGQTQGYTKARWSFVIEDIRPGAEVATDLQKKRNEYAQAGTKLLFDGGGNFIKGYGNIDTAKSDDNKSIRWDNSATDKVAQDFLQAYGANLISVNQFTVSDVDDDNATKLIWYLSTKASDRKACASSAPGCLPEIKFAAGEDSINVAKASGSSAYPATAQRIINCANSASSSMPVQYADDVERDRVEKIEAAAEGVETGRLDKDCSKTGCPGADIVGQTGRVYHASYGRTQFIGATFLEVVNSLPAADKLALGLDTDMQRRLNQALRRAEKVSGSPKTIGMFNWVRQVASCANAPAYWDGVGQPGGMSTVDQAVFVQQTQLDRQAFIDMACFVPEAPARPTNEGRQAFATESILTDSVLGGWMMGIFKSTDRFGFISRTLIRANLREVIETPSLNSQFQNLEPVGGASHVQRQRSIERNLAMRTARLHNSGRGGNAFTNDVEDLLRNDALTYVSKFLGGSGGWTSLRCGAPHSLQASWHGLQLTPLKI